MTWMKVFFDIEFQHKKKCQETLVSKCTTCAQGVMVSVSLSNQLCVALAWRTADLVSERAQFQPFAFWCLSTNKVLIMMMNRGILSHTTILNYLPLYFNWATLEEGVTCYIWQQCIWMHSHDLRSWWNGIFGFFPKPLLAFIWL